VYEYMYEFVCMYVRVTRVWVCTYKYVCVCVCVWVCVCG